MESCAQKWALKSSEIETIYASLDHVTDLFSISRNYGYGLIFKMTGLDANPLVSIEGSNDGSLWTNVYSKVTDPELGTVEPLKILLTGATDPDGVISVNDDFFPYRYLRVNYEANGVTTGTIEYQLSLLKS